MASHQNSNQSEWVNQNPLITWPWHHHDGFNHLEKYDFVNGKDDILYIVENKTCLKPPTSHYSPNNNQKFPHWPSHVPSFSILCVTCGHCGHISYDMSFSTLHVPYLIVHSTKIDKSIYNNCHSFWPTDISIKVAMFIHFSPWNYHDVPHTMTSHDFPWLPMTSHLLYGQTVHVVVLVRRGETEHSGDGLAVDGIHEIWRRTHSWSSCGFNSKSNDIYIYI